jgi:DNA recombination protein RmuC
LELGEKAYWERLTPSPEFVVLFLPGEAFFSAALEQDPALLEYGVEKKVLIASPTTLIALLRAVAYGWKEELMAKHAQSICELGKSLYDRLKNMTEHLAKLKRSLDGSVDSYNKVVASYEARVLPAARKFEELSVVEHAELAPVDPVEKLSRSLEIANLEVANIEAT